MIVSKRDLEVLFYQHHNGDAMQERVAITMGGGCAQSWLTLQEFCELMAECQKEIALRHWQPPHVAPRGVGEGGEPANTV